MKVHVDKIQFNGVVEYENSGKSKARYLILFHDFYLNPSRGFVFYIAADKLLENKIQRIDKVARREKDSKVFITLFDEMMNAKDSLAFTNSSSNILKLSLKANE